MNYWTFGDYLGIGAGAHGKITQLDKKVSIRTAKTRQPEHYLTRIGTAIVKQDIIDTNEIAVEFMMNGLRLKHGVPREFFPRRTGLEPTSIDIACLQLQSQGLIEKSNTHYCTTELGYRFLNSVLQHF